MLEFLDTEERPNRREQRRVRRTIHFALGETFDSLGLYDKAFHHFRMGNELTYSGFSIAEFQRRVARQIEFFTADVLCSKAALGARDRAGTNLIFIVGMPRCGSTLVEQILASHTEVQAGGERFDMPNMISGLQSRLHANVEYPRCVELLDRERIEELRRHYFEDVLWERHHQKVFVDKTLANYLELGFIYIMFPEARIIHCKRNPIDICLSCYFKDFSYINYCNDLHTIARVYRAYERVMDHWRSSLPAQPYEQEYEAMIADPEASVRKLLDFCGLSWQPECLDFHLTRRAPRTASSFQVKMPLYSRSVGRWVNYQRHITGLINEFPFAVSPAFRAFLSGAPPTRSRSRIGAG